MDDNRQIQQQRMTRARRVWSIEAETLVGLNSRINSEQFLRACDLINDAVRTVSTGAGTSAQVAKKIAHTLSCVEIPAFFLDPADAVHGGLGVVQPGDVLIALSKGGETTEILSLLPCLRSKGSIPVIAVTGDPNSTLAGEADLTLIVSTEKESDTFDMLATASTIAVTAVFDALAIVLMEERGFTREQFFRIHPGGAVGARLENEVFDPQTGE